MSNPSFAAPTFIIMGIISATVAFFLLRIVLIVMGIFKDPILQQFERYGDDEGFIDILPQLLGWSGAFIILVEYWSDYLWGIDYDFWLVGLASLAIAYFSHRYPHLTGQKNGLFLNHPRWLFELGERTSRLERRRIAYMWLRLPLRLRLIYNSNDRAFLEWADMVIISTLM
jgi:hypothetical protein